MDIQLEKKKGIRKKHIPYIAGGVFLLLAFGWLIFGNHKSKVNVDRSKVMIQTATKGEFNDYIRINGQVQPINTIQLSAIEGGIVAEKVVEEGSMVHKGDVIVRLTNSMLNLNILDSEAQLAEKQNWLRDTQVTMEQNRLSLKKDKLQYDLDVERKKRKADQYQSLYDEKLVSREDYLQAKEDYEYAVKNRDLVVEHQRQDSIYRGVQTQQMEESLANMRKNLMLVRERPDNIRTGQTYYINLQLGQPAEAVLIPRGAFYQNTGGQWIFVVTPDGKKAVRRTIQIGRQNPLFYEVLSGLEPGDQVVTSGYDNYGDAQELIF